MQWLTACPLYQDKTEVMMETQKPTRAAGMAATYADILIKAGVLEPPQRDTASTPKLHEQIIRGEVNWWEVCIQQLSSGKKK